MYNRTGFLATFILLVLLAASIPAARADPGFTLEDAKTWKWAGSTDIWSVAVGNVDGDPSVEMVTGGWYDDGTRDRAQLTVWDGGTLQGIRTWYRFDDTQIWSVAVGDVDGDGSVEIVTGGHYYTIIIDVGWRWVAQLAVWDGATLALEGARTWHWVESTRIRSVAVGDVDGDGSVEIVTGGEYWDGTRSWAQLCVWDGATLTLEGVKTWFWVDSTYIMSVAIGDVDGDGTQEIITGGSYHDGTRDRAQLVVWDGATLTLEDVRTWHWVDDTRIWSVACANVDGNQAVEIVTGGRYDDGTGDVAQLCVWNGSTLALENVVVWCWERTTRIHSVTVGDVDGDGATEIITGGDYYDGTRQRAQLCAWTGSTMALEDVTTWHWVHDTMIMSVAIGDVDGDGNQEIVTGGLYIPPGSWAQLCVWGLT